ncbi:hypothetical protein FQR65_LT12636 [Abscondita terminalis]|nr:hypothetical protein FQR65_LT12636 [Abscondita terminalis]
MLCYAPSTSTKIRFKIISFSFLFTGLVEHFLYVYSTGIKAVMTKIESHESFAKLYFVTVYDGFFYIFDYAHWKAVYVEFVAVVTTFIWQFTDLFLILMTSSLAERFEQINVFVRENKVLSEVEWRNIRNQYNRLSLLCNVFNKSLSEVILLSYSANVFFISIALFQAIHSRTSFEMIFILFNTTFIVIHFLLVSKYSSWVYEESGAIISEISSFPVQHINHEVDRLLHQMVEREIGVCGGGFFKVTRQVVFNVFNIILTLQLIFVQFKASFSAKVN